jgi:hypothetical protein
MPKRHVRRRRDANMRRIVVLGAIVALLMAGALIAASLTSARSSSTLASGTVIPSALGQCGGLTCGQANAPVTIEIYSDFQ